MQFKRWRLSAARPLVNAGLGLALLFSVSACGGKQEAVEEKVQKPAAKADGSIEMPAVWATSPLDGKVQDIAIAGGIGGTLAVAYKTGGLQLFTLEGDRMTDVADYSVSALARGLTTVVGEDALTVFPGIDGRGKLKAYIHNSALPAPITSDLPIDETDSAAGLCSMPLPFGSAGLVRVAYWTDAADQTLQTGTLSIRGDDFIWEAGPPESFASAITACAYIDGAPTPVAGATDAALFKRGDYQRLVAAHTKGYSLIISETDERTDLMIRDGITVRVPERIEAIAAYGTPLSGGYPNGVIVVAGETTNGDHQAVFVDPTVLIEGE